MNIRLPAGLINLIYRRCALRMARREQDFLIGDPADPYIVRWHLWRVRWLSCCYLHLVRRSNDDRALHDHPWCNISLVLAGGHIEVMPADHLGPAGKVWRVFRAPGSLTFRRAIASHRLVVPGNAPAVTLFLTGPTIRDWGFWCASGWLRWQRFVNPERPGEIGFGGGE